MPHVEEVQVACVAVVEEKGGDPDSLLHAISDLSIIEPEVVYECDANSNSSDIDEDRTSHETDKDSIGDSSGDDDMDIEMDRQEVQENQEAEEHDRQMIVEAEAARLQLDQKNGDAANATNVLSNADAIRNANANA